MSALFAQTLGRAAHGTALYAPPGMLPCDGGGQHVQCHLCGEWYQRLAPTHLRVAHGLNAEQYRVLVGLRPRHPLWAPRMCLEQSERFRPRLAADPRLRRGAQKGRALAASGELQRRARELAAERAVSLERERQLTELGSVTGSARARRYAQQRTARAREHGYTDLEDYYRRRYVHDRARLDQLAAELACAQSAVRGDLKRLGLGPDRTRSGRRPLKPHPPTTNDSG